MRPVDPAKAGDRSKARLLLVLLAVVVTGLFAVTSSIPPLCNPNRFCWWALLAIPVGTVTAIAVYKASRKAPAAYCQIAGIAVIFLPCGVAGFVIAKQFAISEMVARTSVATLLILPIGLFVQNWIAARDPWDKKPPPWDPNAPRPQHEGYWRPPQS